MTITDNGRVEVDEETVARGRELAAAGRMPSKRELQKHLGKGWPIVNAVLTRLTEEDRERRAARRRDALRSLTPRKRSGGLPVRRRDRQRTVNETAPAGPWWDIPDEDLTAAPLTVEKHPEPAAAPVNEQPRKLPRSWLLVGVMVSASVAIWGGWVDLGRLTGFGVVHPFPGIPKLDALTVNLAITLPVGLEAYAAYALSVWLSAYVPAAARRFARWSAIFSLALGFAGQATYHLMIAAGWTQAPWWITLLVSGVPVGVAGLAATLRHLVHAGEADR
jgi:hypothetical protein